MSNTMWGGSQRGSRPSYRPGRTFWLLYGLITMVNMGIALLADAHHPAWIIEYTGLYLLVSAGGIAAIWGGLTWWDRRKHDA